MSSAENEKLLLDRVLSRFAMAESDQAFTQSLSTLLVPTLQVLTSAHAESRNKVVSVLAHVNKRAKNNNDIKLPLKALVTQFKDEKSNAFLRNFNILYIEMAFDRSSEIERHEVFKLHVFFFSFTNANFFLFIYIAADIAYDFEWHFKVFVATPSSTVSSGFELDRQGFVQTSFVSYFFALTNPICRLITTMQSMPSFGHSRKTTPIDDASCNGRPTFCSRCALPKLIFIIQFSSFQFKQTLFSLSHTHF